MGKQVDKYRGFSSAQLKAKADIPAASDIVEYTNYIDCSNIKMSAVKTLLGASTWSLYDLCRHVNVNEWSGYGPTKREVIGGILTNRVPNNSEGYSLGSFAGYNHGATTPHYESVTHDDDQDVDAGSLATFSVQLHLGEARLVGDDIIGVSDTDRGIALTVWDGVNILTRPDTSQVIDIHDLKQSASYLDADKEIVELVTTYTVPASETHALKYDCKIYLTNNLTSFASDESDAISQFTEFADYTKKLIVRRANFPYVNAPENTPISYNGGTDTWTFGKWELKTYSWSASTGVLNCQYLKLTSNLSGSYNHLSCDVYVERGYTDTDGSTWVVEDTYAVPAGTNPIYDDVWNLTVPPASTYGVIDFSGTYPSGLDIIDEAITNTNYGYRIVFDCNVTTV